MIIYHISKHNSYYFYMKRVLNIIKWVLLFIWQIPQNLVALCMLPFMGHITLKCIKRYSWCLICDTMKTHGSISLGNFVLLGSNSDATCAHELGHVKDSHLFGPLYLFIIGLASIIWAGFNIYKKKGVSYYSLYTESRANKNSHLHDVKFGNYWYLRFDKGYNLNSIK